MLRRYNQPSPSVPWLRDERQRQHHDSARYPCEKVVETSSSGAHPVEATSSVSEHGIQGAACFKGPSQGQWTGKSWADPPKAQSNEHPKQRCK